jgi:sigma-B regulation protein RsbU (phosphoserine phosphatase)
MNTAPDALLVVDDNEANREGLSRLLEQHGYLVAVSKDGRHALELLRQRAYDLVLLDVMMAGLSGLDVLKTLRTIRPAAELPVIMTTARGQSEDIVEALKLGANDYVTKPIDFPVLLARIQTQLSLKYAMQRVMRLEQNLSLRNEELEAANGKLRAANARMQRDLEAAARIQEAFLPQHAPRLLGVHFAWIFRPCDQLAGDMLNAFPLDGEHVGLYILDVSGHGVAAALLSVTLSHLLSPRRDGSSLLVQNGDGPAGERLIPPAEVAELLNNRFPWDPATEQFFTLVYGILNASTGELRYVSAGHPPAVYLPRGGEPVLLEKPSLPIGVGPGKYTEHALTLRPGDRLFLYSDGLVEALGPGENAFGKERLAAAVSRLRQASVEDGVEQVCDQVRQWCGGSRFKDDVSILALDFVGGPAGKSRERPRPEAVAAAGG